MDEIKNTREAITVLAGNLLALGTRLDEIEDALRPVPISGADIQTHIKADEPFIVHEGYTAQVIGTYTPADKIPEAGIHGAQLPNGETLRFGKADAPARPASKALFFQVKNTDPETSGGKRSELACAHNIQQGSFYWLAVAAYVYDWGTLSDKDDACFACQMHTSESGLQVGPSFALNTSQKGRHMQFISRYSTAASPGEANTQAIRYVEQLLPFGRWMDIVVKFKHNTQGAGLFKGWIDGELVADHQGHLGYNTPSKKYYAKFGYYNWAGANMSAAVRKVLLRSPIIVRDPTGATYSQQQLRAALA